MYAYQWAGVSSCLLVPMSRSSSLCPKDHWNEWMGQDDGVIIIFFFHSHKLHFSPSCPRLSFTLPISIQTCTMAPLIFIFISDLGVGTNQISPSHRISQMNCPNSGVIPTTDIDGNYIGRRKPSDMGNGTKILWSQSVPLLTTWRARPLETKRVWSNLDFFSCLTSSVVRWTWVGGFGVER